MEHLLNLNRALRSIIISALLSALVYAALAAFTDARQVAQSLNTLSPVSVLAMVALTLGCYLTRAVRWGYLTRVMGHPLRAGDAVYVQLSGMTMTVTPGKVGEVLKGYLARELVGLPMARGVTLVFAERLADVVAVVALSTGAIGIFSGTTLGLGVAVIALVVGIVLLTSQRVHSLVLNLAAKQPWLRTHEHHAQSVSETLRTTLSMRVLVVSVVLSAVAWSLEGVALWVCVNALGYTSLPLLTTVGIYAISTLIGAFTFLPGGIGLTEASMVGLLIAVGMTSSDASATTLLIRVVTMWFGVGLGWATLVTRPALVKRLAGLD